MKMRDLAQIAGGAIRRHRVRTGLSLAGIAVGVAAVVLLTGLGEGARRYVTSEFQNLGSNIIAVIPGKVETTGMAPMVGSTERDLTLGDARHVRRACPRVRYVTPASIGQAEMEYAGRGRTVPVIGTTQDYFRLRDLAVAAGTGLPPIDPTESMRVAVIGRTVQRELFVDESPLGRIVRIGEWRFRIIGVLEHKGTVMGMDVDEIVIVPVATAMQMFNRTGLFRILMQASVYADTDAAMEEVRAALMDRHDGEEDFTLESQGAMLSALDAILATLSLALAGIAAISLTVAGIGIMNVMLVSVAERRSEIGLMKAVGASDGQVLAVFLAEAVALSLLGGVVGIGIGFAGAAVLEAVIPNFDASPPAWAVVTALITAACVGAVFGILPARRASHVDPVVALSSGRA